MTAPKQTELFAFLAKGESSYLGGGSLSASTDAVWLAEPLVIPVIEYLHDGVRQRAPDTGGVLLDALPKGRHVTLPGPKIEARGAGSAYSASNFSRDLHWGLKAAGFKHAVDTSAGVEKVTYTPSRAKADWVSAVAAAYGRDELFSLLGIWTDFQLDIEGAGPAVVTFPLRGVVSTLPSDAAIPAMTFQAPTLQPPRCEGLALGIKDVTSSTTWANVPVRSLSLRLNRKQGQPRTNLSLAGGHGGFSQSPGYDPMLEALIEASALAGSPFVATTGADPYQLRDTKRKLELTCGWGVGGTGNYNRIELKASNAQVRTVTPDQSDPEALWRIQFHLACSAPATDDAFDLITK